MGLTISAACACGYGTVGTIGSGMVDVRDRCDAPASCDACGHVVTVDLVDGSTTCPHCGGPVTIYGTVTTDPHRNHVPQVGDWTLHDGRGYVLPTGRHHCPRCRRDELVFSLTGLWD